MCPALCVLVCEKERWSSIPARTVERFRPPIAPKRRQVVSEHPSCWLGRGQMRILVGHLISKFLDIELIAGGGGAGYKNG